MDSTKWDPDSQQTAHLGYLPAVLRVAERGLTVGDIAVMSIEGVAGDLPSSEARAWMVQREFTVAPIEEWPIARYVTVDALAAARGETAAHAMPISARDVIHESVGLIHALAAFRNTQFLFVQRDREVEGIVTQSDIQKPVVTLAALGVIFAIEQGLTELVRQHASSTWTSWVNESRARSAHEILAERAKHDAQIDLYECLQLADLFEIAAGEKAIRDRIGLSKNQILKREKEWVIRARDTMAHAGSLLSAFPNPQEAVERFHRIRELAERISASGVR